MRIREVALSMEIAISLKLQAASENFVDKEATSSKISIRNLQFEAK